MDIREQAASAGQIERHPWERSRFAFFRAVLQQAGLLDTSSVLDVGSGDAWFASKLLAQLPSTAKLTCWDSGYDDPASHPTGVLPARASLTGSQPEQTFDLIMLMDVLEHVDDDVGFLSSIAQHNLASGGLVLISVPAWQGLMSAHDDFLGHHRRYSTAALARLLRAAGLRPVRRGGLFHSLLLPRALTKAVELARPGNGEPQHSQLTWSHGQAVTRLVYGALRADNWISITSSRLGLKLPGLSTWALCRAAS